MNTVRSEISDSLVQEDVIAFRDVHKNYGSLAALQGLDLNVRRGEVFGFLGRNGAGKSTAIRILMGITRADAGAVAVFGQSINRQLIPIRQRIGYVAQEQNFYGWMTPTSLSRFVSGFYPRWQADTFTQLIGAFDLPPKRRVGTFSGGMKAKLALSLALATSPELLVLDEPTAGMDPVARREFLDLVREQAMTARATIFFSTHLIDDIETAADRIAIVDDGRAIYAGPLQVLTESIVAFSIAEADASADSLPGEFALGARRTLQDFTRRGRRQLVLQFANRAPDVAELDSGWCRESLTLEDVFVAVVSG